jgi:hypothetical protein
VRVIRLDHGCHRRLEGHDHSRDHGHLLPARGGPVVLVDELRAVRVVVDVDDVRIRIRQPVAKRMGVRGQAGAERSEEHEQAQGRDGT